jgi:ATP-dependent RNA helicase SUPV3L1/SUV3
MADSLFSPIVRSRGVSAVLGPTNTGKTHLAMERMLTYKTGMIGLPLRLLAREIYGRVVERVGAQHVALITGEEKIKPPHPRYWIATVEAMPRDVSVDFLAIDEVQLCADVDRGHIFTDRLLNARGRAETMVLGAQTMHPLIEALLPNAQLSTRPRLSQLTHTGECKITRLPPRSAIVAFSVEEVYSIAELIRRQRGGAAVVMGALSPRTRNAQVALYQSGEVDYLVATDAIGMGLNLDIHHVAFAADQKFDGRRQRHLSPAELGQIAGRAGRYLRDGTFGTTGRCLPFDDELVEALQTHTFDPLSIIQWRSPLLDMSSLASLKASLGRYPSERGLVRCPEADDERALDLMERDSLIASHLESRDALALVWQVARVPDYRKLTHQAHGELLIQLARHLLSHEYIPEDWMARQIGVLDRIDGDIDTLSARMAHMRTWAYVANQNAWLAHPEYWQEMTRALEEKLSDALHERLTQRFIDRRTGVLLRRLKENGMIEAQVTSTGEVNVEGQLLGTLMGFQFAPDPQAEGVDAKALKATAARILTAEMATRAERLFQSPDTGLLLSNDGLIRWEGHAVGRMIAGEALLKPRVMVICDEHLMGEAKERAESRLAAFVSASIQQRLAQLVTLEAAEGIEGMARGIAYQLTQALGVLDRASIAHDVKSLDQEARVALRNLGVRFGAYHLFVPALLKPKSRQLAIHLWLLHHDLPDASGLDEIIQLAESGRTSFPANTTFPADLYRIAGYKLCETRAVRVDILERLADLIRPALNYRPGLSVGIPPEGAADHDAFVVTGAMTSLAGCAGEDFSHILKALGYVVEKRAGPAITKPIVMAPLVAAPIITSTVKQGVDEASETTDQEQKEGESEAFVAVIAASALVETPQPVDAPLSEATEISQETQDVAQPTDIAVSSEESVTEVTLIEVWRAKRHHTHHSGAKSHSKKPFEKKAVAPKTRPTPPPFALLADKKPSPDAEGSAQAKKPWQGKDHTKGKEKREGEEGISNRKPRREESHERTRDRGSDSARGKTRYQGDRDRDGRDFGQDRLLATTEKPRSNKEPDLSSPFAKLLALKNDLKSGS